MTAALEFAVLACSLSGLLLRVPPTVVWMLVGTVVLMAGDMAFSLSDVPPMVEPTWMLGQFMVLSAVLLLASAPERRDVVEAAVPDDEPAQHERSGISGILILASLGSVLLSPLVWFLPVGTVWKSFLSSVFIVTLVVVLVWTKDRFDDTVANLRGHVRRAFGSRLEAEDWRRVAARVRAALGSTGSGPSSTSFKSRARDGDGRCPCNPSRQKLETGNNVSGAGLAGAETPGLPGHADPRPADLGQGQWGL